MAAGHAATTGMELAITAPPIPPLPCETEGTYGNVPYSQLTNMADEIMNELSKLNEGNLGSAYIIKDLLCKFMEFPDEHPEFFNNDVADGADPRIVRFIIQSMYLKYIPGMRKIAEGLPSMVERLTQVSQSNIHATFARLRAAGLVKDD